MSVNKILVIPDVHGRTFWKEAVEKYTGVDKVIFTGDYHDPYEDEGISNTSSIKNLEEILTYYEANKEKVTMLIGNHDYHYIEDRATGCTRYDKTNSKLLHEMFSEYTDVLKVADEDDIDGKKYLFTHAGFMASWYEQYKDIIGEPTVDDLNKLLHNDNGVIPLWSMSNYRMWFDGDKTGSILWSDIRERLSSGEKQQGDWYQIFGHTQLRKPVIMDTWACLDYRRAFIIDSDGIKEV